MFNTKVMMSDGSSENFTTKDEIEITPENGMIRMVFFKDEIQQVLIRTDLVISISVKGEAEKETAKTE